MPYTEVIDLIFWWTGVFTYVTLAGIGVMAILVVSQ